MTILFLAGFALGLILGVLLVLAMLIFAIHLDEGGHRPQIVTRIQEKVDAMVEKKEARIFSPPTDLELAQEAIIKEHSDRGEDTPIEKL